MLRDYHRHGSETAFAELVRRHIHLVYSVAARHVGVAAHAEEITQAVFIILARKAAGLRPDTILEGWLHETTRLTALSFLRGERRRRFREQEAYMQSTLQESPENAVWHQIAPLLDEAIARLGKKDRDAVILRFFKERSVRDVAAAMQVSELAAQRRVLRAVDKLRQFFAERGVDSPADAITNSIAAHSIQMAPAGLAAAATAAAKGAAASTSTLTLVKGALKIMAWTQTKNAGAIVVGAVVLLAGGTIATGSLLDWLTNKVIPFEAQGTVTYAAIWPDATYTRTEHFTVARDGNIWKIRTTVEKQEYTGPPGDTNNDDLYWEMGFDGTNLYTLEQQDKDKLLATVPPTVLQRGVIFAEGSVQTAGSPPHNDAQQFYPVWLAYCSAPYFEKLKGDKAVAPRYAMRDFMNEPVKRIELAAKWDMHDRSFVKDVSWFSDGTTEGVGPNGKSFIEKYQPPYDKPFVEGRFEILSWTNWNGVSVPSDFKLTVYRPDYASTNIAKFVVATTVTGTLGQIQNIGKFSPVPQLNMATRITDLRIKVRPGLQPSGYISTNLWNITNSVHSLQK